MAFAAPADRIYPKVGDQTIRAQLRIIKSPTSEGLEIDVNDYLDVLQAQPTTYYGLQSINYAITGSGGNLRYIAYLLIGSVGGVIP